MGIIVLNTWSQEAFFPWQYLLDRAELITWRPMRSQNREYQWDRAFFFWWRPCMRLDGCIALHYKWPSVKSNLMGSWLNIKHFMHRNCFISTNQNPFVYLGRHSWIVRFSRETRRAEIIKNYTHASSQTSAHM